MRDVHLIVWLTQLGLSVIAPLGGCTLLAVWLRNHFGLGIWVIFVGLALGLYGAVGSFRAALAAMRRLSENKKDDSPPPVSFNDHD